MVQPKMSCAGIVILKLRQVVRDQEVNRSPRSSNDYWNWNEAYTYCSLEVPGSHVELEQQHLAGHQGAGYWGVMD